MPYAWVDGPAITDLDKKRTLTKEITDALEKAFGLPRQAFVVVIKENPPDNICIAGELVCDLIALSEEESPEK